MNETLVAGNPSSHRGRMEVLSTNELWDRNTLGRLLIVDDDPDICALLKMTVEGLGYSTEEVYNLAQLRDRLTHSHFDCVLLDIFLGKENGMDALPVLLREAPLTKVIMITGQASIELAVEAMKQGASSFILKSSNRETIAKEIQKVLESSLSLETLDGEPLPADFGLIGNSLSIRKVRNAIQLMKDVDSTVLIRGESGTGKELVARALHKASSRATARFGAVNCGAIPENLLESELFGYRKGAFTDAKSDRKGIFEICSGGTLLLDEIGEMPLSLQVKLLRVLQEREVVPIGSTVPIKVDTRVIASSNRKLDEEVEKSCFREDLFYRLSVLQIEIPPLRSRREDIPALVETFIEKFNQRFFKVVALPSREVMARLVAYDWPGNVRELQNMIERGVVLAVDHRLQIDNLFQSQKVQKNGSEASVFPIPFNEARCHFERAYLTRLLRMTRGNISEASRLSDQHRAKIYRMLKRYHIAPEQYKR